VVPVLRFGSTEVPELRLNRNRNTGTISRRHVLAGIALAPFAARAQSALERGTIERVDVTPDVKVLRVSGLNIVVLPTSSGLVVVDSGAAADKDAVVAGLRQLAGVDGKVAAVINTHWHRDQTGANEALGTAGATIIAHDKTRQRLRAGWYVPTEDRYEKPLPQAALPTKSFFTTDEATIGEKRIELGYLLEAHTDGDAYVRFADANVIAAGGALSPTQDPVLDWFGGGWLGGRLDSLKKLLSLGDARTRYVPSVGPPVERAEVQAEHDLMLAIFDRMVVNLRMGQTAEDMLKAGLLDGLPRTFEDPAKFLYDAHKGFWAHHNKLMNDIV
jgi:glyoxylase-like metal-dependent hydrolase (beta-lactamase superfamily II)